MGVVVTQTLITHAKMYTDWYYNGKFSWSGDPGNVTLAINSDSKPSRDRVRKSASISKKCPGWLLPKPYSREIHTLSGVTGWVRDSSGYPNEMIRYGNLSGQVGQTWLDDFQYTNGMFERAQIQAMLKLKASDFNAAVSLGEAGETADMIATTAKRLVKALGHLRRKDPRGFFGELGIFSGNTKMVLSDHYSLREKWLEHRYGWVPLLSDVDNACKALDKVSQEIPPVITGKGLVRERRTASRSTGAGGAYAADYEYSWDELAYCRLDFLPGNFELAALKSLGITNPAEVAWELLPLSFVADWFVPVGDFLSCFDYAVGLEFLSGSMTQRIDNRMKVVSSFKLPPGVTSNFHGEGRQFKMNRSVYNDAPFVSIPPPKNGLNLKRAADALALLTTAFHRS